MNTALQLSILDYAPVDEGLLASDALAATVRLAQQVEAKGFIRYWVSEHHGMPATASNSLEILMARIASATSTIRVGSGGVLLPNYSSLKIAENYELLGALFHGPDRSGLSTARPAATGAPMQRSMMRNQAPFLIRARWPTCWAS